MVRRRSWGIEFSPRSIQLPLLSEDGRAGERFGVGWTLDSP